MMSALNILLLGQHGQLAFELQQALSGRARLQVWGRTSLDLSQSDGLAERVLAARPDLIINAAAYTAVEQAESDVEAAMAINATAPGILAQVAAQLGIPLIHFSTDYVFDGSKASAYHEDDPICPTSVYGRSKAAGEQAIRDAGCAHLILRTSWVYSHHGHNFLLTMQRLLQEKTLLKVVDDQIGAPTWAGSLAAVTVQLIQRWQSAEAGPWGTYHLTAQGETSWFGFAQAIAADLKAEGKPCAQLQRVPSSLYPSVVRRPLNSRLDCSRLRQQWQISLMPWQDALRQCLQGWPGA